MTTIGDSLSVTHMRNFQVIQALKKTVASVNT